ncbi:MAG: 3-methylornithine--L-lysine ligase PylC [archaeon]|nr:3-methylornithine--L-lysine ligase PylC [archaeon]MCP8318137.1 3-methylornithine--L-lysine ligase PylC [archaeon]MCP8319520.1 3-methylornithine--L-lysine ligase PylC [archaeon]
MKICVVGGRLQGTEATYLAKKAGYEVILIDKDSNAPASSLADEFHALDLLKDVNAVRKILNSTDAVLPATENKRTLSFLERLSLQIGIPYMQDNSAFWVSSDKIKSMEFFDSLNIPHPELWPNSGFPVVVKPASKSGSVGIYRADNEEQLRDALKKSSLIDEKVVVQKFINGPALSLEVIALDGNPLPLQITQLEFDETYGCKRVFAPDLVNDDIRESFIEISKKMARGLNLGGLMDAQSIVDSNNIPLMIEINARLPSQTPTVVYHSSGINMVNLLVEIFVGNKMPHVSVKQKNSVIYQHIKVNNSVTIMGEHIMSEARNLRIEKDFFGVDEAITNLDADKPEGVATLIVKTSSLEEAKRRSMQAIEKLMAEFHLIKFSDSSPRGV